MKHILISLSLSLAYSAAQAQVDPSNSLLLKSNSQTDDSVPASNTDLDNGRYVIKAVPPPPPATPAPRATIVRPPVQKALVISAKPNPPAVIATVPTPAPSMAPPVAPLPPRPADRSFTESVQDTVLGGTSEEVAQYKEKLQPDDPRRNMLEVSVAPGYFYTNSSSSYWYRRYFSGGPSIDANVKIWFTPFVGINLGYMTTLAADMNGDPTTSRTLAVDHRYTDFSFEFRKYFSYSKKSPILHFNLGYDDYQMIVPSTETNRIGLQEYGLDLGLHLTMPISNFTAWTFGADIIPFMKINEQSTGIAAQSGANPAAYAVKFSLGQDFTLDRSNKVFWRLSERLDKSEYTGTATQADPITGVAPSGVSVTGASTLFEFGYSWGD